MSVAAKLALFMLVTVWAGIIIGVSLIATPVKFQAPSLTMPVGLEVGRYTFRLLARVELCFLIAVLIAAGVARPRPITLLVLGLIAIQMLLQRYWLLPVLDNRVSQILAGSAVSVSIHHLVYAVMEIAKSALLITAAVLEFRFKRQ